MISWWWLLFGGWATGMVGVLLGIRLGIHIATVRENSWAEDDG
jgi:hypothetical protein